jgi:hypothetical protein
MSPTEPLATIARSADPSFSFVDPQSHYDGAYFYAVARDPIARGNAHGLIDRAAYRYGHPGYGWLAWIASAGRPRAVPAALLGLGLVGGAVAAFAASRVSEALGWSPWGGLVVAVTPGIVYAVTADTSEPVALAVLSLALLAWLHRRWRWAALALGAGCFVKEPLLLAPIGLFVWELVAWFRRRRVQSGGPKLAALAIGPVLYVGWYVYLRSTFGIWPFRQEQQDFLTLPLSGWWDSMRRAARLAASTFDQMQIGNAGVALIAVTGLLLLVGIVRAVRAKTPLDPIFVFMALLVLSLNWYGVLYPKDLIRETALPMALLPAVVAGTRAARPDLPPGDSGQGNAPEERTS